MEGDSKRIAIRKSMQSNKNRDTKPEILLRQAIWDSGIKGYRKNYKKIVGKPDIYFTKKKIAIFLNGCFWHQCLHCKPPRPKTNSKFWNDKLDKNIKRDQKNYSLLKIQGIKVIIVWECELKRNFPEKLEIILKEIKTATLSPSFK